MAGEEKGHEPPTEKRKQDARKRGDRPRSRDLAAALTTGAGLIGLAAFGTESWQRLTGYLASSLAMLGTHDIALITFAPPLLTLSTLLSAALIGVGLAIFLGGAPAWSLALPKLSRLDPLAGLGRVLGPAALGEAGMALVKTLLLTAVVAIAAPGLLRDAAALSSLDLATAAARAGTLLLGLMAMLAAALAVGGALDLPLRILQWLRRNRMTHQQHRDESRESDGAPELKSAQRRRAHDILNRNARAALKDAAVVLTNPTEFAVALRYERHRDRAPVVAAKGRGATAQALRDMAAVKGLPVVSQPTLARALYFTAKPGDPVREELFVAVATVLAWALSIERRARGDLDEVDVPEALRFGADGTREV